MALLSGARGAAAPFLAYPFATDMQKIKKNKKDAAVIIFLFILISK